MFDAWLIAQSHRAGKVGMSRRTTESLKKRIGLTNGKRVRKIRSAPKMLRPNLNHAALPVLQENTNIRWLLALNPDGVPSPLEYLECDFTKEERKRLKRIDSSGMSNKNNPLAAAKVAPAMLRTRKTR